MRTGELWLTIRTGQRALLCGAWSPDGKTIATGSDHGLIQVWPVDMEHVLRLAEERLGR